MTRVLQVVGVMSAGGMESRTMDIYRNIDRQKVQFDFLVHAKEKCFFDDEIIKLGGKIIPVCRKSDGLVKNLMQTIKVMRKYDIVHIHSSYAIAALDAMCAFIAGCKIRIIHSRSSNNSHIREHTLLKPFTPFFANYYFAVSGLAGQWMFPSKILNKPNYKIINNAVNSQLFIYNLEKSNNKKKELDLVGKFVIGHVGRLTEPKNHIFLLEAFANICNNINDAILVFAGEGEFRNQIESKIAELNLQDKVYLLGLRRDIAEILQAFDMFAFPSKFEGLPGVVVEAQASGLKCLVSEAVTGEVAIIPDLIEFLPISNGTKMWEDAILKIYNEKYERRDTYQEMKRVGFDIEAVAKWYEEFYLEHIDYSEKKIGGSACSFM